MINGVSAITRPLPLPHPGGLRQDYQALKTALANGDVEGAQTALAQFAHDIAGKQGADGHTMPPKIARDLQQMQQALSSGDIATAQQVFVQFTKDGEHLDRMAHHHQNPQVPPVPTPVPSPAAAPASGSASTSVDVTA